MAEGPLGVDRPFVRDSRELIIKFEVFIEGQNVATFNTPKNINELSERVEDASGYVPSNIRVIRADAPSAGPHFIVAVKPATGEFWRSIDRKVKSITTEVDKMDNVRIEAPVPMATTFDEIEKDNSTAGLL